MAVQRGRYHGQIGICNAVGTVAEFVFAIGEKQNKFLLICCSGTPLSNVILHKLR